jgi:agmatine/peptidylarginine deiminase
VFAEARNVTDFKQDESWDRDFGRIIYTRDDGRSYWLGLSFRY